MRLYLPQNMFEVRDSKTKQTLNHLFYQTPKEEEDHTSCVKLPGVGLVCGKCLSVFSCMFCFIAKCFPGVRLHLCHLSNGTRELAWFSDIHVGNAGSEEYLLHETHGCIHAGGVYYALPHDAVHDPTVDITDETYELLDGLSQATFDRIEADHEI